MRTIWPFRHVGLKLLSVALARAAVDGDRGRRDGRARACACRSSCSSFPPASSCSATCPRPSTCVSAARPARSAASRPATSSRCWTCAPGERLFHLTPEQVRAPFGVEVVQVTPPTVAVAFEKTASRNVPIAGHRGQAGGRLHGRQEHRGSADRRSCGARKRGPSCHRSADRAGVGRRRLRSGAGDRDGRHAGSRGCA